MPESTNSLYHAAICHFEAKASEAKAVLELYFENSVAVGDHSNVLDEITKWTQILAEAEDCLSTLSQLEESDRC